MLRPLPRPAVGHWFLSRRPCVGADLQIGPRAGLKTRPYTKHFGYTKVYCRGVYPEFAEGDRRAAATLECGGFLP